MGFYGSSKVLTFAQGVRSNQVRVLQMDTQLADMCIAPSFIQVYGQLVVDVF